MTPSTLPSSASSSSPRAAPRSSPLPPRRPLAAPNSNAAKCRKLAVAKIQSSPRAPKNVSAALPSNSKFTGAYINARNIATPAKLANIIFIMRGQRIFVTLLSEAASTGESSYSADAFQVHNQRHDTRRGSGEGVIFSPLCFRTVSFISLEATQTNPSISLAHASRTRSTA